MSIVITNKAGGNNNYLQRDYTIERIFIGPYETNKANLTSTPAVTIKPGSFVSRAANGNLEITTSSNLANVIGVVFGEQDIDIAANGTAGITYAFRAVLAIENLTLPTSVTLDTINGGVTFRDILQRNGFELISATDQTKHANA